MIRNLRAINLRPGPLPRDGRQGMGNGGERRQPGSGIVPQELPTLDRERHTGP